MAKKRTLTTYILFGTFAGVLVAFVIAATLAFFNIPEAGLLLIIGIDQFLDMGRSATNPCRNPRARRHLRPAGSKAACRRANVSICR